MPPRTTNPYWQLAKPLLKQDFRSVKDIESMTPDQVIALRPEIYGKVPRKNFLTNWNNLKKSMKNNKDDPPAQPKPNDPPAQSKGKKVKGPTNWEISKPLLEKDYLAGIATDNMTADQVIALKPTIYGKVPRSNFLTNWRALKARIKGHMERAEKDDGRYEHDMETYMLAKDLPWEWHGSDAEQLLKEDVAMGRDLRYPPCFLYLKRKEYQEFDYEVFRKHIHQEARSALETPYWMVQKEKKAAKKKKIQDAIDEALEKAKVHELGNAFAELNIN